MLSCDFATNFGILADARRPEHSNRPASNRLSACDVSGAERSWYIEKLLCY